MALGDYLCYLDDDLSTESNVTQQAMSKLLPRWNPSCLLRGLCLLTCTLFKFMRRLQADGRRWA